MMGKLCVYGEHAAEALHGTRIKGGLELQSAIIARTAAAHGMEAAIVDPWVPAQEMVSEHLTVYDVPNWNRGIRGFRFFQYRLPGLIRVLRATGADLYYARGFSFRYLVPLYVAKRTHAKFVLAVASDTDLLGFRQRYNKAHRGKSSLWDWISTIIPNEIAYRLLMLLADVVAVQHDGQARWAQGWGKRVVRLNNILEEAVSYTTQDRPRRSVIAVGTFSLAKGLPSLLPVVAQSRQVRFEFVGGIVDREGRWVWDQLQRLPNVTLWGPLGRAETLEKIAGAKALINTSPHEGFPNTFLEAWALGTPVISLCVDPGGVVRRNHLGFVCDGDIDFFQELVQRESYDTDPSRLQAYVAAHHSPASAFRILQGLLGEEEGEEARSTASTNNE